jgi:hypothetical protein
VHVHPAPTYVVSKVLLKLTFTGPGKATSPLLRTVTGTVAVAPALNGATPEMTGETSGPCVPGSRTGTVVEALLLRLTLSLPLTTLAATPTEKARVGSEVIEALTWRSGNDRPGPDEPEATHLFASAGQDQPVPDPVTVVSSRLPLALSATSNGPVLVSVPRFRTTTVNPARPPTVAASWGGTATVASA